MKLTLIKIAIGVFCSLRLVSACSCVPDLFEVLSYDSTAGIAEINHCGMMYYTKHCYYSDAPENCADYCSTFTYYEKDFLNDLVTQIDTNKIALIANIDSVTYDTIRTEGSYGFTLCYWNISLQS